MTDKLTNAQIALLCDIGEFHLHRAPEKQRSDLAHLLAAGFIEKAKAGARSPYALTLKGVELLSERGAGLNEA